MDNNEKTMMLKPTDAYEYMKGKGYRKSMMRFRQLIQDGAFPNMKTIKRGRRLLHAIPVSDLDNFDAEAFNQKVGRRPDPEAKYHNWRKKSAKKQAEEAKKET